MTTPITRFKINDNGTVTIAPDGNYGLITETIAFIEERDRLQQIVDTQERAAGHTCFTTEFAVILRERDAMRAERDELTKMYALACADGAELARVATRRAEERKVLEAERDALQAFKAFVHLRYDQMGVPKEFPDGKHSKEGCRIGDRIDFLEHRLTVEHDWAVKAQEEVARLREASISEAHIDTLAELFFIESEKSRVVRYNINWRDMWRHNKTEFFDVARKALARMATPLPAPPGQSP